MINKKNYDHKIILYVYQAVLKGVIILSHGVNEHALCYYTLAITLVEAGYVVYGIDHESHGYIIIIIIKLL